MPIWEHYHADYISAPEVPVPAGFEHAARTWIRDRYGVVQVTVETVRHATESRWEVWIARQGQAPARALVYHEPELALQGHRASSTSLATLVPGGTLHETDAGSS